MQLCEKKSYAFSAVKATSCVGFLSTKTMYTISIHTLYIDHIPLLSVYWLYSDTFCSFCNMSSSSVTLPLLLNSSRFVDGSCGVGSRASSVRAYDHRDWSPGCVSADTGSRHGDGHRDREEKHRICYDPHRYFHIRGIVVTKEVLVVTTLSLLPPLTLSHVHYCLHF